MESIRFVSLADSAFEQLENDIFAGIYEKGDILTETKLSEILGISRTPIREAIKRLEQEKLVKLTSKGIVITGLSKEDIEDIYEIRIRLEGLATAKCIRNINDEKLAELCKIIDLQEFYTQRNNPDDISGTDSKFHEFIYNNCGSEIIAGILLPLHRKIQKYRKLSVQSTDRAMKAVEEHRKIYNAILCRNESLAESLVCEHILNAKNNIIRNISK